MFYQMEKLWLVVKEENKEAYSDAMKNESRKRGAPIKKHY